MLLYGAGGHGRVVQSCLTDLHESVDAIFDDDPATWNRGKACPYTPEVGSSFRIFIAIGNNHQRRTIAGLVKHRVAEPVVHPSSLVAQNVSIGLGSIILHRAIVQTGVTIGQHVIVNTGAIVEHDGFIGNFAHIAPGAVLCGGVQVGEETLIGAGSIVVPGIKIGNHCLIKAGSVVTRNVPDHATIGGNPGLILQP